MSLGEFLIRASILRAFRVEHALTHQLVVQRGRG
jgi:hypothetical protein